jgi:hypothetical protein
MFKTIKQHRKDFPQIATIGSLISRQRLKRFNKEAVSKLKKEAHGLREANTFIAEINQRAIDALELQVKQTTENNDLLKKELYKFNRTNWIDGLGHE